MTAKIDLTDLFELFGKAAEKPSVVAPISPEARKWRRTFTDNVAAILRVRDIPRVEAEGVAFENTVTAFLDAGHLDTPSDRCAHCGRREEPGATLRPIGTVRHAWLHNDCWTEWAAHRRADAIKALGEMGIVAPIEELQRGEEPT